MVINQWDSIKNVTCDSVNRCCPFTNGTDVINYFSMKKVTSLQAYCILAILNINIINLLLRIVELEY